MTVKPVHLVIAEQLNALMDQVEQGPWDHYEAGRDREAIQAALALKEFAVRYKDHGATAAFKVAPIDVIDQAIERGRMTAAEVAKHGPDAAIAADIEQFFTALAQKYGVAGSSGGGTKLTDSGDQSKMATKAAAPNLGDMINRALTTMKEIH